MKTELKRFIENRKAEILAEIQRLNTELEELILVESTLLSKSENTNRDPNRLTIKEMVLEVLKGRTTGADANEILELIAKKFKIRIARESLSPQLSRLKEDGKLFLVDRKWISDQLEIFK